MLFKRISAPDKEKILRNMVESIQRLFFDGDSQFDHSIGPQTLLKADLALKSVQIARLAADMRKRHGNVELPIHELFMPKGRPVEDLSISDLVDFLFRRLSSG
jgi:hypothetical protein